MTRDKKTVYIADGFADDCEEVIHRCSRVNPLTYCVFAEIWKDMNMAGIYKDRASGAEIAELTEEVVHIAKHYMLTDSTNYEESVAGLFLVYALLALQPFPLFGWLRLVPSDVAAIRRIELVARRERRFDVLRILGDVLVRGTQYHAAARERGIEPGLRKYFGGTASIDQFGMRPKGVFQRQNEELDLIREISSLSRLYIEAKGQCGGRSDRNLCYADHTLGSELDSSLRALINGITDDGTSPKPHIDTVQTIKARAMRTEVSSVGHLTGVKERAKSSAKRNPKPATVADGGKTRFEDSFLVPRSPRKSNNWKRNKAYLQVKKSGDNQFYELPVVESDTVMSLFPEETLRANATKRKKTKKDNADHIDKANSEVSVVRDTTEAENGIDNCDSLEDSLSLAVIATHLSAERKHDDPVEPVTRSRKTRVFRKPCSPRKRSTLTYGKRKSQLKRNSKIKRRKSYTSSSESNSDVDMCLEDSDDDTYSVTDDIDKATDIDDNNSIKDNIEDTSPVTHEDASDKEPENQNSTIDTIENQSLEQVEKINKKINEDIYVGKPILIQTESGAELIEIEIIETAENNRSPRNKNIGITSKTIAVNKKTRLKTCGNKNTVNKLSIADDVTIQKLSNVTSPQKRTREEKETRKSTRMQSMAVITKLQTANENNDTNSTIGKNAGNTNSMVEKNVGNTNSTIDKNAGNTNSTIVKNVGNTNSTIDKNVGKNSPSGKNVGNPNSTIDKNVGKNSTSGKNVGNTNSTIGKNVGKNGTMILKKISSGRDKREMKKSKVSSTLRRMGIHPVANLKEPSK